MVKDHTHTYVKLTSKFYRCDDPECYHKISKAEALGKLTTCAVCRQNTFVLTREDLRRSRPRCIQCSGTKKSREINTAKSILEDIFREG